MSLSWSGFEHCGRSCGASWPSYDVIAVRYGWGLEGWALCVLALSICADAKSNPWTRLLGFFLTPKHFVYGMAQKPHLSAPVTLCHELVASFFVSFQLLSHLYRIITGVIYRAIGLVGVMYCPVNDRQFEAALKLILPSSLLLLIQLLLES